MLISNNQIKAQISALEKELDVKVIFATVFGSRQKGISFPSESDLDIKVVAVNSFHNIVSVCKKPVVSIDLIKFDSGEYRCELSGYSLSKFLWLHRKMNVDALGLLRAYDVGSFVFLNKFDRSSVNLLSAVKDPAREMMHELWLAKRNLYVDNPTVKSGVHALYHSMRAYFIYSKCQIPRTSAIHLQCISGYDIMQRLLQEGKDDPLGAVQHKEIMNTFLTLFPKGGKGMVCEAESVVLDDYSYDEIYRKEIGKAWYEAT